MNKPTQSHEPGALAWSKTLNLEAEKQLQSLLHKDKHHTLSHTYLRLFLTIRDHTWPWGVATRGVPTRGVPTWGVPNRGVPNRGVPKRGVTGTAGRVISLSNWRMFNRNLGYGGWD